MVVALAGFLLLRQQPAGTALATSSPPPGQPTPAAATENPPATFAATDAPAATSSPLPATDAPTAEPSPTAAPSPTAKPTPKPTPTPTPVPVGTLRVIVSVVNDDGGTASAADFQVHVSPGACCGTVSPETFAGSESGTDVAVDWGASWGVTMDRPAGYRTTTNLNCDVDGPNGWIEGGTTQICIFTANDIAPEPTAAPTDETP